MKQWRWLFGAVFLTWPWFFILFTHPHLSASAEAIWSGLAIVGAAFLLSWGAEVAQLEVSRSLAIAFVAVVAVLPEYAVDIYIAGKAGKNPMYIPYAIANMTGANRLIIGVAWAMVAFLWWLRSRKTSVKIEQNHKLELFLLFWVTIYSFLIPFKKVLSIWDGVILIAFYLIYLWSATRGTVEEPELEGPSEKIAALPKAARRSIIFLLFSYSFVTIFIAAKAFTEGLIKTGEGFHLEPFLLIQIIAPLASEAPEFIVAGILAFRGNPGLALGVLLSSKFNQWTLLIGMTPMVFAFSAKMAGHAVIGLPLDSRQIEELFLTSAQSLYAISLLRKNRLRLTDALILLVLYMTQYIFRTPQVRFIYAYIYIGLAFVTALAQEIRKNPENH